MKAAWYTAFGPAIDVLATGELDTPEPSEGEVRVRVIAGEVIAAGVDAPGPGVAG